jgi:hypothetical protein
MENKKGQCPVGFLWRGHGFGLSLIKAGICCLCMLVFIKMVCLMLSYQFDVRGLFWISLGMWLAGKCLTLMNDGAQKRTRTSTK